MGQMFYFANLFNGDISEWDVSNVIDMSGMFSYTDSFNEDISNWDVSSVTNMHAMFYSADVFNLDISGWDISSVTNMSSIFGNTWNLSEENKCAIQESFSSNSNWPYNWCQ